MATWPLVAACTDTLPKLTEIRIIVSLPCVRANPMIGLSADRRASRGPELRTGTMKRERSDKFTAGPGAIVVVTQCAHCVHFAPRDGAACCKAFPGGIPGVILANKVDHRKPFEGDGGVRFEPKPDVPAKTLAVVYGELAALAGRQAEDSQ